MDTTNLMSLFRRRSQAKSAAQQDALLSEGDIDSRGLEVGKTYELRAINRARRLSARHDAAQRRKQNRRYREDWRRNQRDLQASDVHLVRAVEKTLDMRPGELADRVRAETFEVDGIEHGGIPFAAVVAHYELRDLVETTANDQGEDEMFLDVAKVSARLGLVG